MNRVKVLQLLPAIDCENVSICEVAENITRALPSDRYEVVVASLKRFSGVDVNLSHAARTVSFGFDGRQLRGLRLSASWKLFKFLRRERFDVVICHRFKPISLMMRLSWLFKPSLCVGVVHGFGEFERAYRQNMVKGHAQRGHNWRFVSVSASVRQYLLDLNCGFTDQNTVAITNAVDQEAMESGLLDKREARAKLGIPDDALVVGSVGRLSSAKGHIHLIRAFAQIAEQRENARLVLMGDGEELDRLQQAAQELGISDRVDFLGFVPDAKFLIRAFDVKVMPSLREGLGLSLLEAMVARVPVVASALPAMKPLVEGAGGLLVPPGNPKALAEGLETYLALSDAQRQALGDAAYAYVTENHRLGAFQEQYRALLESRGALS